MAKKILVVDDEPALVKVIAQVLTKKGYEVLEADNGQEALRLFFTHKPDMVLLDVVMPGLDGWQTCNRIRDISPTIPIIMLTGKRKTEDDVVRGLDHGADEYLLKPVGNRELVARVRAVWREGEIDPDRISPVNPPAGECGPYPYSPAAIRKGMGVGIC